MLLCIYLFLTRGLPAGAVRRDEGAASSSVPGLAAMPLLLPGQPSPPEHLQCLREPRQGSLQLAWVLALSLLLLHTHHQRPWQLALGVRGAGEGQSSAQPGGAAPGFSGASEIFPEKTRAPSPLGVPVQRSYKCSFMYFQ